MKLLENIKVLDLTNVLSGPFATLHLALLGAEVIKVENPIGGDLARNLGCVPEYNKKLMGTSFIAQNANKKSLTLNLKEAQAIEIFKILVTKADILVENFRPGVMDRLGIGYSVLKAINPRLVYVAISGYGQTGPDSKKPAYDQIMQGLSGEMAINGSEEFSPLRAGFPVCDTVGGLNAAFAAMAGLFHCQRTGEGQFIDIALLDSIMPMMGWVAANLMIGGQEPQLLGNDNFTSAPSGTFTTKDGYINIAANKQEQWEVMADLIGLSELKNDDRFALRDNRKKNRWVLNAYVNAKLVEQTTEYWVENLNKNGIPSGAILSLADALNQPQIEHRKTFAEVEIESLNRNVKLFNLTAKFEKTPGVVEKRPPELGEDTHDILTHLGYKEEQIIEMKNNNII
jgi:crotonobetainyl-CoA:carnitine CoA-transferase CaiB-like acyl-CoA transferase